MTAPAPETLLAAVERSPQAAAAHDRTAWVSLFTDDGRVEDPVGSRPHVGHAAIGRFFDTFIGPREITFHRHLDVVAGTVVLRDLELEVAMGPDVTMHIPAFLRYDLREDLPEDPREDLREINGDWRIARLRAYWELPAMVRQFLRSGTRAMSPALRLSRGLLGNQGPRGAVGFMAGFRRPGARHQERVAGILDAAARGDRTTAARGLSPTAAITAGDDEPLDIGELVERLAGARPTKTISAGPTVVVAVDSGPRRGIVFADVTGPATTVDRLSYFPA
ncbi:nuclear transport factor 2 family protein [Mycobacterium sp. 050134]|uniref:nuclear transport factor 2 family protein n=1 Tax=Mycobacterium sp. 050134 TaxID=3096111 RepID=UPI002EDAF001